MYSEREWAQEASLYDDTLYTPELTDEVLPLTADFTWQKVAPKAVAGGLTLTHY